MVEDRFDPEHAGRLRVPCLGHHNPDKNAIATSDLPWSSVIYSDGGISGLGSSPGLFVEGTWVWGYFRDGLEKQEPVVLGALPGVPSEFVIQIQVSMILIDELRRWKIITKMMTIIRVFRK